MKQQPQIAAVLLCAATTDLRTNLESRASGRWRIFVSESVKLWQQAAESLWLVTGQERAMQRI
jgi:hypothetical protein